MSDDKSVDDKVKELLARPVESMADAEALEHIGGIVDLGADLQSSEITDKVIQLLDALGTRSLSEGHEVLRLYFLSNAYATRVALAGQSAVWVWEQTDRQKQIIELRRAIRHPGFERIDPQRQCQILTNLANQLNTVGRFVEAIELWDRALAVNPNFAMALGNRGAALLHYARALYHRGHAGLMYVAGHDSLDRAVAEAAEYDMAEPDEIRKWFTKVRDGLLKKVRIEEIRESVALDGNSLGETADEKDYRTWGLRNRLFLNPLNDLGPHSIAARDTLMLPPLRAPISVLPPPYIGFFNQMKQEFVSARFSYYEGITSHGVHFSDRDVLLYNTLEYPVYCLAVERLRAAYRVAYSLLDKIGFFVNSYFAVGYKPNEVNFSKVWREPPGKRPKVSDRFANHQNWPLRGLYWLSKDIFEGELQAITEPDAQALKEVREHLEHKYLQVHQEWAVDEPSRGTENLAVYPLGRDVLSVRTLRVLKLVRAALTYLSLAVHREEQERESANGAAFVASSMLEPWDDDWKQ